MACFGPRQCGAGASFDGGPSSGSGGLGRSHSTPLSSGFLTSADLQQKVHSCIQFAMGGGWQKDAVSSLYLPPCLDGAQAKLFATDHLHGLHRKMVTSLPGLSVRAPSHLPPLQGCTSTSFTSCATRAHVPISTPVHTFAPLRIQPPSRSHSHPNTPAAPGPSGHPHAGVLPWAL